MFAAVHTGYLDTTRLLLDAGADPNLDPVPTTELLCTKPSPRGQADLASVLLDHGARTERRRSGTANTRSNSPCFAELERWLRS